MSADRGTAATSLRERLRWYPPDVDRYVLAAAMAIELIGDAFAERAVKTGRRESGLP